MKIVPESHLDHGLTDAQIDFLRTRFADKTEFFIETVTLPPELGTVPCALYGPCMSDPPVPESEVFYVSRGTRAWPSRMVNWPVRPVSSVTVIAGPGDGPEFEPCVLYTAFGGPLAPQEPDDPGVRDRDAAAKFWSEHALVML